MNNLLHLDMRELGYIMIVGLIGGIVGYIVMKIYIITINTR